MAVTDHVPLQTLSQDAVPQVPFFHSSCTTVCPLLFSFSSPLPLFFILSARNAMPPAAVLHYPPFPLIPVATMSPTPPSPPLPVSTPPHMPTTATTFATLSPRTLMPLCPCLTPFLPSFFTLVSPCLCLAVLSVPPIPTSLLLLHNVH